MKNILIMTTMGVGLFCVTVVALLGVQGRLNHAGTQNIPLLSSLFAPPPVDEHKAGDAEKKRGASGGHGEKSDSEDETAKSEPPIDYVMGESIKEAPKAKGGHGGGHGGGEDEAAADSEEEIENLETPSRPDAVDPRKAEQERRQREFTRAAENLRENNDRYETGRLFDLRKLEPSGMTVDEVNNLVAQTRKMQETIELERKVLEKQRRDLEVRERDIADRQARLDNLINEVDAERKKVEQTVEDINKKLVELSVDEVAALKETARTVGSLDAQAARELVLDYWRTPDGQTKVIKILAVMEAAKVDEIIAQMETRQMREILEKRMTIARTGRKKN